MISLGDSDNIGQTMKNVSNNFDIAYFNFDYNWVEKYLLRNQVLVNINKIKKRGVNHLNRKINFLIKGHKNHDVFITNMKHAWSSRKYRANKSSSHISQLNIGISSKTKKQLEKISKEEKLITNKSQLLEKIIDHYFNEVTIRGKWIKQSKVVQFNNLILEIKKMIDEKEKELSLATNRIHELEIILSKYEKITTD